MTAPRPTDAARQFVEAHQLCEESAAAREVAWHALPRFLTHGDALVYGYNAACAEHAERFTDEIAKLAARNAERDTELNALSDIAHADDAELHALRAQVRELEALVLQKEPAVWRSGMTVESVDDAKCYAGRAVRDIVANTIAAQQPAHSLPVRRAFSSEELQRCSDAYVACPSILQPAAIGAAINCALDILGAEAPQVIGYGTTIADGILFAWGVNEGPEPRKSALVNAAAAGRTAHILLDGGPIPTPEGAS